MDLNKKYINLEDLRVGMITSKEIMVDNAVLVGKNIYITEAILNKLVEFYPFKKIWVYDPKENNHKEIEELKEVQAEFKYVSENIKDIFIESNINLKTTSEISKYSMELEKFINTHKTVLKNLILNGSNEDSIYKHSVNVASLSYLIGKWHGYDSKDLHNLVYASLLHDFGKTKIDENLINKTEPITKDEYDILKTHSAISYNAVKTIPYINRDIAFGILLHHERNDGSGYPLGIEGDKIPAIAKIIAIADVFDAINSNRLYKKKKKPFEALQEIKDESLKGKLDYPLCNTFLTGLSNFYIGQEVVLSNGEVGRIIQMDINNISKPLILCDEEFIDLKREKDITITQVL